MTPAVKREAVAHLKALLGLSERRACRIVRADRKMVCYEAQHAPDTVLRDWLRELANERRRFGYRRLFVLLCCEGEPSGIYRLYREDGGGSENGPGDRFPDDTHGAQAEGPTQSDRHAGPDPGRGATQRTLVAGFRSLLVCQLPMLPGSQRGRRRYPGMPRGDPGHFDIRTAHRTRVVGPDRASREAWNDCLR